MSITAPRTMLHVPSSLNASCSSTKLLPTKNKNPKASNIIPVTYPMTYPIIMNMRRIIIIISLIERWSHTFLDATAAGNSVHSFVESDFFFTLI